MTRFKRGLLAMCAAMPVMAAAQSPLPFGEGTSQKSDKLELGGRSSMDLVRLESGRFSIPLRFANIRPGSERIDIGGVALTSGLDYSIDYASGVVYLLRTFRDGQSMRVQYKYDEVAKQVGVFAPAASQGSGYSGMRLEFTRDSSLFLGLGMTERLQDGTVLSSNVYGVSNSYAVGGGTLKGLFMVGERNRSEATSLFGAYQGGRAQNDEGTGKAILQNFTTGLSGGQVSVDYQDVDEKFAAFDSLKQNGFSDQDAAALRNERGLKRSGLTMRDIALDKAKFSSSYRTVGDADAMIQWKNYGIAIGNLSLNMDSQSVSRDFTRFKDLKEADKQQLQNERGLDRETLSGKYAIGKGGLGFNSFNIEDAAGNSVSRQSVSYDSEMLKFSMTDQSVGAKFAQFAGLRPDYGGENKFDVGQIQREVGLDRRQTQVESKVGGAAIGFTDGSVKQGDAGLDRSSAKVSLGRATIEHKSVNIDKGFQKFASLTPQEQQDTIKTIADMAAPGANPGQADLALFGQNSGLDRDLWRMKYDFGGGTTMSFSDGNVSGTQDGLETQDFTLSTSKLQASFKQTLVGDGFNEITRLMQSEQGVYGLLTGVDKTNFDLAYAFDKTASVAYSQMEADSTRGDASRRTLKFKNAKMDLAWSKRSVDDSFNDVRGLADPERDLLAGLIGFEQESFVAKFQVLPQVGVSMNWSDAKNDLTTQERSTRETGVDWKVASDTTLSAYRAEQRVEDADSVDLDREFDRLMVRHNLGRFGIVSLLQEQRKFNGEQDSLPDSIKHQIGYETSLNKTTKFGTEQSELLFEDGERETASTNTISTNLTDRVGVSVSDTKILRDGDKPNSTKRDYGFWLDFGKNVRFSYGVARNLMDSNACTENVKAGLTAGQFSGIDVKSLQYTQDIWDGRRNRSTGNVNIKTVKPLSFGAVNNVEFFYLVDTIHDMDKWQKENRSMGISGSFGTMSLGFGYRSQISPTGDRAIDRVLSLNTDKSGKQGIRAELNYDLRTMPDDKTVAVRDLKFVAKPLKGWEIEHSMLTNPLKQDDRALLGGIAQETRVNNWRINMLADPNFKGGFVFEELQNDRTNQLTRKTGVDLTLFAKNPSPLVVGYRSVLSGGNVARSTSHEFWLKFVQRPGPNQSLSLSAGNLNFEGLRPSNRPLQDWSLRLDYGFRF